MPNQPKARTAWLVTRGSYSDYSVLCVVDSKKRAVRIAAALNSSASSYDTCVVEPLPYFDHDPERLNILRLSEALMDDGSTRDRQEEARIEWEMNLPFLKWVRPVYWRWFRPPYLSSGPVKGGVLEVAGVDHERVRKVFSEKRAEILAGEPLRDRGFAHA